MIDSINDLNAYMGRYGVLLGEQAAKRTAPLHTPGVDELPPMDLLRVPYEAQAHVIAAGMKLLKDNKAMLLVAECGTGKTLMGASVCHMHADGKPYRAAVMCPAHLVQKWRRELIETIPYADVKVLKTYRDLSRLRRRKPRGNEWYVFSGNAAKMETRWVPSYYMRRRPVGIPHCPDCGQPITKFDGKLKRDVPMSVKELGDKRRECPNCKGRLWQFSHNIDRWPIARFLKNQRPEFLDYAVVDEMHKSKSSETAIGKALGELAAASKRIIGMTGTLIGGYSADLLSLMYRLSAATLVADDIGWKEETVFAKKYGRIETRVYESKKTGSGTSNRESSGSGSRRTTRTVKPGIMPTLFGKHLIDKCVFLSLSEVAEGLPDYNEQVVGVPMDFEQEAAYAEVETALKDAIADMVRKGDKRLLGTMLRTLLGYPDYPYDWETIGYQEANLETSVLEFIPVVTPRNLGKSAVRPKEQMLLETIATERKDGRQCWVFTPMSKKRDCVGRLQQVLQRHGYKAGVLRSEDVAPTDREEWIATHGPKYDVMISHPGLVETGLDLFDKGGAFNYASLMFYQTGYSTFTLRQASRRAWRLGQLIGCKTFYFFYRNTMQSRALTLMGRKLVASEAIEGKFSADGLAALAGDDGMEMALAKSLVKGLDDMDVEREWSRVACNFKAITDKSSVPMFRRRKLARMHSAGIPVSQLQLSL